MAVDYSRAVRYAIYSQEIYQNFSTITFGGLVAKPNLITQASTDTQCAILSEGNGITIVFRGSESQFDWETDFDTIQEQVKFDRQVIREEIVSDQEKVYPYAGESSSGALMHRGFVKAYFSVRDQIHEYIRTHEVSSVVATGHSLGGALATLCAVDVQYNFGKKASVEAFTFGAPKVGNDGFRTSFNERVPNSYRFVHGMDIVPELPRWWQGYRAVDKEIRIGQRFSWNFLSQRFKDHAIDRYINVLKEKAAQ
ncbi:lipase family protein [Kovacikia minuta CCNUW1]|uniref:lipase family protein n=1 Tax=Kovacikia minuta TaxID=2931930 RepID=UPI001CCD91BA|nr:lipase family protein [Kovacikia minuta]UBF24869.1 lipase family protein [Kovacikia minuta CCNUW1]